MEINKIYNENCLVTLGRMKTGSIDLLLQDTPYGTTACDWDVMPDFPVMWEQWERIMKPNATLIFFGSQPFTTHLIHSKLDMFRYELIWEKTRPTGFFTAKKMPMKIHENILVFYKNQPTYNPEKIKAKEHLIDRRKTFTASNSEYLGGIKKNRTVDDGYRYPNSIIKENSISEEGQHPTQKPLDIIRKLVRMYSNIDDIIFDGYSGSGTTAAACIKEKRRFICSENHYPFYEKSIERIELLLSQPELF